MKRSNPLFASVLLSAVGALSLPAQADTSAPPAPATAQIQTNAAPAKPRIAWKSSAAAGLTMTRGNSELTLATASADTDGKWDQNELLFSANGAYGRSKGQGQAETTSTADLARGVAQYNRLFGDRCYTFGRVEGRHDGIANLAYRVSLGAGAGYFFIKNTNTDLSAEVGPGYVFQKQGNDATSYTSVRFGERFNQALSDRARLWQSFEYSPQVDDFNNFVANGVIGLEADLTRDKKLALRSFVTDSFNNQPVPGFNRNDLTWVTAIAYKF